MELLLMAYHNGSYAVDMNHVSRVVNLEKNQLPEERLLSPTGGAEVGILLKNDLVLPCDRIDKMLTYEGEIIPLNGFLKGCTKNDNIESFVIIDERIYSLLSCRFLKINAGVTGSSDN